jgi:hypothetical protein
LKSCPSPTSKVPHHRFAITAAAENTFVSCWVAYRDAAERAWAEEVLGGLAFVQPKAKRRLFGRR